MQHGVVFHNVIGLCCSLLIEVRWNVKLSLFWREWTCWNEWIFGCVVKVCDNDGNMIQSDYSSGCLHTPQHVRLWKLHYNMKTSVTNSFMHGTRTSTQMLHSLFGVCVYLICNVYFSVFIKVRFPSLPESCMTKLHTEPRKMP